jgi:hypothetical protein
MNAHFLAGPPLTFVFPHLAGRQIDPGFSRLIRSGAT